jgi:tetratricopeptide (TPR) repeat protein
MKFTNVLVVFSMLSIALLNGCTSLSTVFETEPSSSEAVPESMTQIQVKVKALQAQPNLYKTQTSGHKVSTQAFDQFQRALLLKKQAKFVQAREKFIALSEQHPSLSGIWLQLALVIKEQGKGEIAQRHQDMTRYLENAITANPLNYSAHNELAQVLRHQGQFQQALKHYELALKSWPAFEPAYLNRGILYDLYIGEKSLALADYELYQALSNDSSRQLKGWIIDLQRQIKSAQQITQAGGML